MRLIRRVIQIRAADSPNVRAGRVVVPGVLSLEEYEQRRALWDEVRQCVGLDAEFWQGADALLYPPDWLDHAARLAEDLRSRAGRKRQARAIGCDPGEGGADTAWAAVDELGLIELKAEKTPDTSVIDGETIAFGRKHGVPPSRWLLDRGGGGKQVADRLRRRGYPVRTVAFGGAVVLPVSDGVMPHEERAANLEERYAYVSRRAQMYGDLRQLIDPSGGYWTLADQGDDDGWDGDGEDGWTDPGPARAPEQAGWAIPAEYTELRRQMAAIPLTRDGEGRLYVIPKQRPRPDYTGPTLEALLGCSPDELDAVVLAVHGMLHERYTAEAGAA